jgi:hypothetical protein
VSENLAVASATTRSGPAEQARSGPAEQARSGPAEQARFAVLDPRRKLQLALALVWLLDGILQFQPWMFGKAFPRMLADSAQGNPGVLAAPITWSAGLIGHDLTVLNALFATIQVALGLGIACRASVKYALGASVAWSLGVWWFGEGFGGVLAGTASPVNGAPGAVILYAVAAILLWPADRDPGAPFVAGRAVGRRPARALWLVLWASLAVFSLTPASRAPQAISGMISDMVAGEPSWLAWIDGHAASALAHQAWPPRSSSRWRSRSLPWVFTFQPVRSLSWPW